MMCLIRQKTIEILKSNLLRFGLNLINVFNYLNFVQFLRLLKFDKFISTVSDYGNYRPISTLPI